MTASAIKTIQESLAVFLKRHKRTSLPIVIGFSGGVDSLALTYLLHGLRQDIHLAHFDHGWRKGGRLECRKLAAFAKELDVPFHVMRATRPDLTENGARIQRWTFFQEIMATGAYEALTLAHQLEDQAETVLKRLLEGCHLHHFRGMQPVSQRQGMVVWRPLLAHCKGELAQVVKVHGGRPIEDQSNGDRRYLRARMRGEIFPQLSKTFGKNVTAPLCRLGQKGSELSDYLQKQTKGRVLCYEDRGPYYDLDGAHPVEIDFILSKSPFSTPSYHTLKIIHRAIEHRASHVRASGDILVDRGRVIWTSCASNPRQLKKGVVH